ncbi:MAG: T9SS type A sorting domain-containing protein [Chitinophagaceae bacterium]
MKHFFRFCLLLTAVVSLSVTYAQVPKLSSNPSASAVIFLDFDGHTVDGTSWNYAGPIVCGASGLNNTQITTVFNRIAEDYRPFEVNITTDSSKFLAAPINKRIRVIATVSSEWYGSAGGVAFVGSFTWGDDTPCFVFSALLNYNIKNISEAIAHEAGHTLSLYHQASYDANCVKTSDYNYGQGSGEIGWAPIMGVGYYQNLTLWNNGPNSYGCTNLQTDLSIITSNNGFGFRTDDFAGTFTAAVNTPFVSNQFTVNGIVSQNTDQDMIKFTIPSSGRFQLNAIPYNVGTGNAGSDLDLQVTLYKSDQAQLNVYNPGTLLNSVIDTILNPGTYYLKAEGKGNIYAPNYASLGSYSLQGTFGAGATLPLRQLKLNGQLIGDKHQLNWIIEADEQVTEQILEMSTDGINFRPVTQPATDSRSFYYKPVVSAAVQYRLNVTFDNGRQYYSNIITIRQFAAPKPQLVSNIISNGTIAVKSPGTYSYMLYDLSGKTVRKGQLTNGYNTIITGGITGGMYVIRFGNQSDQWTEKLILQ